MSHINRRKFITGSAAVISAAALGPMVRLLPVPPTLMEAMASLPAAVPGPYDAFAEALVAPILAEIKEASVMRQIMSIKKLEEKYV